MNHNVRTFQCLMATIMIVVSICTIAAAEEKAPIPNQVAQQQALALIKEIYGSDFEAAKSNEQKTVLAKKLIARAAESQDLTNKYSLLRVAKDVAVSGCDVATALMTVDEIAKSFQVDALMMKASVLYSLTKVARTPGEHKAIAQQAMEMIDIAIDRDDYDTTMKLVQMALSEARQDRDMELAKSIVVRLKSLREMAEAFKKVKMARSALQSNPDDPDANLVVGKYLCLIKGDWAKGLPLLVQGGDVTLKAMAQKDLAGASTAMGQMQIGDGWWDVAENEEADSGEGYRKRARYWYRQAQPELTGLMKDKVDLRLTRISFVSDAPLEELEARDLIDELVGSTWEVRWSNGVLLTNMSFAKDGSWVASIRYNLNQPSKMLEGNWTIIGQSVIVNRPASFHVYERNNTHITVKNIAQGKGVTATGILKKAP